MVEPLPYSPTKPTSIPTDHSTILSSNYSRTPTLHTSTKRFRLPTAIDYFFLSTLQFPSTAR